MIRRDFTGATATAVALAAAVSAAAVVLLSPLIGWWPAGVSFGIGCFVSNTLLLWLFKRPSDDDQPRRVTRILAWLAALLP